MVRLKHLTLAIAALSIGTFTSIDTTLIAQDSTASQEDAGTRSELHPIAMGVKEQIGDYEGPFVLVVKLKTKAGKSDEFIKAFKKAAGKTRKEEGNMQYQLSRSFTENDSLMLYERWKSLDALDAHLKQPYIVKLLTDTEDILAEPPQLNAMQFRFGANKKQ